MPPWVYYTIVNKWKGTNPKENNMKYQVISFSPEGHIIYQGRVKTYDLALAECELCKANAVKRAIRCTIKIYSPEGYMLQEVQA